MEAELGSLSTDVKTELQPRVRKYKADLAQSKVKWDLLEAQKESARVHENVTQMLGTNIDECGAFDAKTGRGQEPNKTNRFRAST